MKNLIGEMSHIIASREVISYNTSKTEKPYGGIIKYS